MLLTLSALQIVIRKPGYFFKSIVVTIFLVTFLFSCKKVDSLTVPGGPIHHLQNLGDQTVKIGQAVSFYDVTGLNDSLSFVHPPTDKYYEWKVIPDNGCVSFSGSSRHGSVDATIGCAGNYQIFAHVFDSASNAIVAITDTITFEVINDTLFAGQPLVPTDVLTIEPSISKIWYNVDPSDPFPSTRPPDEVSVYLSYETTAEYEYHSSYNHIPVASSVSGSNYSFVFGDSVNLVRYPYVGGAGTFEHIQGSLGLKELQYGVPVNFSIVWLGETYTGKVTLVNEHEYSIDWDNSGAVKLISGCCRVY
jgi:hypothetical protein